MHDYFASPSANWTLGERYFTPSQLPRLGRLNFLRARFIMTSFVALRRAELF